MIEQNTSMLSRNRDGEPFVYRRPIRREQLRAKQKRHCFYSDRPLKGTGAACHVPSQDVCFSLVSHDKIEQTGKQYERARVLRYYCSTVYAVPGHGWHGADLRTKIKTNRKPTEHYNARRWSCNLTARLKTTGAGGVSSSRPDRYLLAFSQ